MTQMTELSRSIALALTRRQLLQRSALGAGAIAIGWLGFPRLSRGAGEINFWASATLDIEGGWETFTKESGVEVRLHR